MTKLKQLISRIGFNKEFKLFVKMILLIIVTFLSTILAYSLGVIVMLLLKEMGVQGKVLLILPILVSCGFIVWMWFTKIYNFFTKNKESEK
jgi:hypothetical protein